MRRGHGSFSFVKLPKKGWASERDSPNIPIDSLVEAQPYSLKKTNETEPYYRHPMQSLLFRISPPLRKSYLKVPSSFKKTSEVLLFLVEEGAEEPF